MKTEKVFIAIALLAVTFKLLLWPGGNFLLLLALAGLAMVYFPGGFYFLRTGNTGTKEIVLSIIGGMVFSVLALGMLFRWMFWPGGSIMLLQGVVTAIPVLIALYIFKSKDNGESSAFYNSMLVRTVVLIALGVLFYFTNSYTLLKIQYRNDPEMARLKNQMFTHPDNKEYYLEHEAYVKRVDSLERVKYREK